MFIILSKDQCKACLFSYDYRSYSLFEKSFTASYKFMKVVHAGDDFIYSIDWKDVVWFLESLVVKSWISDKQFCFQLKEPTKN